MRELGGERVWERGVETMYELVVETGFAAAHRLREYHGDCENLHGHNWKLEVVLAAEKLDKMGMVCDFRVVKKHLAQQWHWMQAPTA